MGSFRAPFFWLALLALVLAILVELASMAALQGHAPAALNVSAPGWGVRYLGAFDLVLLFGVLVVGLGSISDKMRALVGRLQAPVALVGSFFGCLGVIAMAFAALAMLALMVGLLIAVPFGTIAYLAAWSEFPADRAQQVLALIMFLKFAFCILLVLAQQSFLTNKGLVVLTALSLALTWVMSFLIGFPPGFLASITDMIGALVIAIVTIIWLALLCIASLLGLIPVIRSLRR